MWELVHQHPTICFQIFAEPAGSWVLRVMVDGTIDIGPGYTPSEAGEAFLAALAAMGVTVTRAEEGS